MQALTQFQRDDIELNRLEQLGMKPGDESKILVLRDYILKLADATRRYDYCTL